MLILVIYVTTRPSGLVYVITCGWLEHLYPRQEYKSANKMIFDTPTPVFAYISFTAQVYRRDSRDYMAHNPLYTHYSLNRVRWFLPVFIVLWLVWCIKARLAKLCFVWAIRANIVFMKWQNVWCKLCGNRVLFYLIVLVSFGMDFLDLLCCTAISRTRSPIVFILFLWICQFKSL